MKITELSELAIKCRVDWLSSNEHHGFKAGDEDAR